MVDDIFLQNAVRIRRTYLKLSSNMDMYQKKAKEILDRLDDTVNKINELQAKADNSRKNKEDNAQGLLSELVNLLSVVEDDGKALETMVEPLNIEISKLALEEQELYRQIKVKHHEMSDDEIYESVKSRLIEENLF